MMAGMGENHDHAEIQPDNTDITAVLLEDLHKANDERMFHKAEVRKYKRLLEQAEMKAASLQARLDQVEAGTS